MNEINREIALIGSAIGWGSGKLAGENGPGVLQHFGLERELQARGITARWQAIVESHPLISDYALGDRAEAIPFVAAHTRNLASIVKQAVESGKLPVTLGGDHSTAIGHYAGLTERLTPVERIGIVWLDAHPDCNVPETSPSMACHGMALSAVLGYGAAELARSPALLRVRPENVCLVGTRSIDDGEREFIARHAIKVFSISEIERRGLRSVFEEALSIVTKNTVSFGLTIDLDALDPIDAPGVAFPEPNGIRGAELIAALPLLLRHSSLLGIEISEYAPEFDSQLQTARLASDILSAFARR
jgi:arginase